MKLPILTLSLVALAAAGPANAVEIKISAWAPPSHQQNAEVLPGWAKCVQKASNGEISWKMEYNLAPPPAQFNVVRKGIGDVTFIFHGYNAGRYVGTKIAELPGTNTGAEAASVAYWRTHEKYLKVLDEHRGVRLIGLHVHPPAVLMSNRKITDLKQLKGMKLRLPGGVATSVFTKMGVTPVKVPSPKVYEVLSTGVADGAAMTFEALKGFKLYEVVKDIVIMPGGFYYGSFAIIMNPKKHASLSKAHKKAVDQCSGENLSRLAGRSWDRHEALGRKLADKHSSVVVASRAMQDEFAPIVKEVTEAWFAEAKAKGLKDPKAALEYLREQARNYK